MRWNILLIDDSPDDREFIARTLRRATGWENAEVIEAESGRDGLRMLRQGGIDCILLDYSLPERDGLEVLNEICLRFPDLPVVMITGEGSEGVAANAFRAGVADYVTKGDITGDALSTAIARAHDTKCRQQEVLRQACTDELTGLPNRRAFNDRLEHIIERSSRDRIPFALAFLDLDKFKPINDNYGHDFGDEVLREVARRLSASLRLGDMLARIGGDEFVVILENLGNDDEQAAQRAVDRLRTAIVGSPLEIRGEALSLDVSIGLAIYPRMADGRGELMRHADRAMYREKLSLEGGTGQFAGDRRVASEETARRVSH